MNHPPVLEIHRAAQQSAVRQAQGQAGTEDLRHGMIHYRPLFEELMAEPPVARPQDAGGL